MINFIKKLFSNEGKAKDPVCGMMTNINSAKYKSNYRGRLFYFCSAACRQQFEEKPGEFVG